MNKPQVQVQSLNLRDKEKVKTVINALRAETQGTQETQRRRIRRAD